MVPDDTEGRDSLKKVGRELISHGTFNGELVVVCVDGTRMQVRASVTPILRKSEVEYYVAVFDDITEEIGLRELNRANQEKLNAIMDNIPVSITLMDSDGRFTFYNRQAQNNLAFTEEELKNKTIVELFPREGPTTLKAIRRIFREKKPSFTEVTYQTQTGLRHYEINRLPLFDASGAVHNVMSIANDITRKRYEEKVIRIQRAVDSLASIAETFEDSLKILFDNLFELDWLDGGGLYMVDPENKCLQLVFHRGLSARFIQKVKSYPLDSAQGLAVLSRLPYYSQAGEFIESSQPHLFQEKLKLIAVLPLVFHDTVVGALNLASRTAEQLDDFDRQAIEAIALKVANLIELIRTREELTLTNVQLKKQMEEIREKQDLLIQKSKLESLGELAAGMAHEISQPLSVISLAFENILYKLQEHQGLSEYFTRKSNTINLNIEKIRQLIDHIRVFSRDQATVMFEKVDINQAIHNSLEMISEQMKKNHIAVSLDLSPNRCYTLGNLTKVEQVMMNLISNARDAIEEKAASKSAKHYIKKISISSICEKERLLIVVEDNGTGIAPENQDKLMNPFFTTKPPGQGTGLGLSIVFGIITEMKGTIDITSEFHNFTRITITLPKI